MLELAVVVGLIGLIAMIAVPSIRTSRARSLQKEAQANLATLYGMMTNYRIASGTFTACLTRLGFDFVGGVKYYAIGFNPADVGSTCGFNPTARTMSCMTYRYNSTGSSEALCAAGDVGYSAVATDGSGLFTSADLTGTSISYNAFTMQARGRVKDAQPDVWTMNHEKKLINIQNGL